MSNKKFKGRVLSLGELVRYLGKKAEEAGVEVLPGFAASALLLEEDRSCGKDSKRAVAGVITGDVGIAKDGVSHRRGLSRGVEVRARATLLAEGARGSLTQQAEKEFKLREQGGGSGGVGAEPQTYALGLKEVWSVSPERHSPGTAWHTVGFPLPSDTYGGGFLYHLGEEEREGEGEGSGSESGEEGEGGAARGDAASPAAADAERASPPPPATAKPCRVSLGLVVGLDYKDPTLNPYQASLFRGGRAKAGEKDSNKKRNETHSLSAVPPSLPPSLPPSTFFFLPPCPNPRRSSSASSPTQKSASSSRGGPAAPTAHGRSTREAGSRCRGSTSPAGRFSAAPPGRSSCPESRGSTQRSPPGSRQPRSFLTLFKKTTVWRGRPRRGGGRKQLRLPRRER